MSADGEAVDFSSISFSSFLYLRKLKGKALFAKYDADLSRVSESTLKADSSP